MQDDGLEAFEEVTEIATDVLREYLEDRGYTEDQAEDLADLFKERLESYISVFLDDLPEAEEEDGGTETPTY